MVVMLFDMNEFVMDILNELNVYVFSLINPVFSCIF